MNAVAENLKRPCTTKRIEMKIMEKTILIPYWKIGFSGKKAEMKATKCWPKRSDRKAMPIVKGIM